MSNKYLEIDYRLFDVTDGKHELIEQTTEERPFSFVTGLDIVLDAFEKEVAQLKDGESFDFTLTPEQAFGPALEERKIQLDRSVFVRDGKFDEQTIFPGAFILMRNENGQPVNCKVVEVGPEKVTLDLNHPLAGMTLNFQGTVKVNRDLTQDEVDQYVKAMQEHAKGHCHGGHCHHNGNGEGHCCGKHKNGGCHGDGGECHCKDGDDCHGDGGHCHGDGGECHCEDGHCDCQD